jgi:type IV pilus assembly protein PilQ
VPVLGDLPIVGVLFKTRGIHDDRKELLIFLTPRIINPALTAG